MRTCVMRCATIAMILSGCGATVRSTVSPGANLSRYKTYSFYEPPYRRGKSESPAEAELKSALRNDLAAKGLGEAAPAESPDFLIAYHVLGKARLDARSLGYGVAGQGRLGDATLFRKGTLIVDFLTPQDKKLFWRGTASAIVRGRGSADRAKLDRAVVEILGHYPAMTAANERPAL